jgi:hypothetical protein
MFQYKVKSNPGSETYLNILGETEELLDVQMVTFKDGYEVEKRETMTRRLFDSCLRTGYLERLQGAISVKKSA